MKPDLPPTPAPVLAQIAGLRRLALTDLRALWQQVFSQPPTSNNRPFLERRLAYRLQEQALAGAAPEVLSDMQRRLAKFIHPDPPQRRQGDAPLMPGTVVTRVYQGETHTVAVTATGQFDYRGQHYRSLSAIARAITGTRWSGPLFFGLKSS